MPKEFDLREKIPSAPKGSERNASYVESLHASLLEGKAATLYRPIEDSHGRLTRRVTSEEKDVLVREADALHRVNEIGSLGELTVVFYDNVLPSQKRNKRKLKKWKK